MKTPEPDEVGKGFLSRVAAAVYRYLVLELLLIATCLPTLVVVVLLGQERSNLPLQVLALLPVAPAMSAALAALRDWAKTPSLTPARPFWHAYRRDLADVAKWWVPLLLVATLLTFNLANLGMVPAGAVVAPLLVVLFVVLVALGGHLLIITSAFSFRTLDAAKIALRLLGAHWKVTTGILALVLIAGAVVFLWSEAVLLLFAWAFPALLNPLSTPLIADITKRFTVHE